LLYAWDDDAQNAVVGGLVDEAWRVREMTSKVVRVRQVVDAENALATLVADPVPRVRVAAVLALGRVGEVEHAELISGARRDEDPSVRGAAGKALAELTRRLDIEVR
jgi:HEAT repeat protein